MGASGLMGWVVPDDTSWEDWDQLRSNYHLEDKVFLQVARNDSNSVVYCCFFWAYSKISFPLLEVRVLDLRSNQTVGDFPCFLKEICTL